MDISILATTDGFAGCPHQPGTGSTEWSAIELPLFVDYTPVEVDKSLSHLFLRTESVTDGFQKTEVFVGDLHPSGLRGFGFNVRMKAGDVFWLHPVLFGKSIEDNHLKVMQVMTDRRSTPPLIDLKSIPHQDEFLQRHTLPFSAAETEGAGEGCNISESLPSAFENSRLIVSSIT